jgi:mannose-6-phosphate isomerase-like protein (cupin superfamily)
MDDRITPFQQRVTKPWGWEVITTPPRLGYAGKILFVTAGKRLSLQYHDVKEETICLLEGEAVIWLDDADGKLRKIPMERHKGYTVRVLQRHRIEAVTDALLVEASDPEKGSTFRIEDDYARGVETEQDRANERTL